MNDRAPYQLPPVMPTRDFNCGSNNRCKIDFFFIIVIVFQTIGGFRNSFIFLAYR